MTGQIPDKVIYNSEIWSLVGVKGEGLHEPIEFGLTPSSPHTANWRGFVSTYKVSDMKLFLNDMEVCIKDIDINSPEINGIKPESRNESK